MTRTRRRILALCLTLALVAGAMAAAVLAASGEPEQTTEPERGTMTYTCLLYTSDAADEL